MQDLQSTVCSLYNVYGGLQIVEELTKCMRLRNQDRQKEELIQAKLTPSLRLLFRLRVYFVLSTAIQEPGTAYL